MTDNTFTPIYNVLQNLTPTVISIISLWVAIKAYSQSIPKLQLNMFVGSIFDAVQRVKSPENYLIIQIVNLSKRPITIKNIGGHYNNRFMRSLRSKCTILDKPRSIILLDISPLIFKNGEPRILMDGDYISHNIQILSAKESQHSDLTNVKSIWVSDASGREYYLKRSALKELKKQVRKMTKQNALAEE